MALSIYTTDDPHIIQQFVSTAQAHINPPQFEPAGLCVYHQEKLIAGVCGYLTPYWLYVDVLWVHEQQRGQGWGHRLMAAIEQAAVQRGVTAALLGTTEFQARPFYEYNGYYVFGEYMVAGHKTYTMRKTLTPTPDSHDWLTVQVPLDDEQYGVLKTQLDVYNEQYIDNSSPEPVFIVAQDEQGMVVGGIHAELMRQDAVVNFAWCGQSEALIADLLATLEMHAAGRQILFRTDDGRWAAALSERSYAAVFTLESFPADNPTIMFIKGPATV